MRQRVQIWQKHWKLLLARFRRKSLKFIKRHVDNTKLGEENDSALEDKKKSGLFSHYSRHKRDLMMKACPSILWTALSVKNGENRLRPLNSIEYRSFIFVFSSFFIYEKFDYSQAPFFLTLENFSDQISRWSVDD